MKILDFFHQTYEPDKDNVLTECPWCYKEKLSMATETPHQFACWSCHHKGNAYTYLQRFYELLSPLQKSDGYALAELKRGIKPITFKKLGIKPSPVGYIWPVFNHDGIIVALYKLSESGVWYSSPKPCAFTLLGVQDLQETGTIYICEGHWDYAAFLSHIAEEGINTIGLCGSSFPSQRLSLLEDRSVVFLADNDEAGRAGVSGMATKMKQTSNLPKSLKYLDWESMLLPSGKPEEKYDIRDLILEFQT